MNYGYPVIPENISVHLGLPDSPAKNVTVPFSDYIKNVASNEIYPTWPENAIRANIYAQVTYALNRIYTEFYRSKGYDFDITNSTQYDQAYVHGREIYENISKIADEIFNSYIAKQDSISPHFARYCNGTTTTCQGLSKWGTVDLAEHGYIPYNILQHYYGDDINIISNVAIENVPESYPGQPLRLGTSGNSVKIVQSLLNRIRKNYPSIPQTPLESGVYDKKTENAVKEFQRIFSLTPDGVVGKATWYKIRLVYNAVKKLNDLYSESLTIEEIKPIFSTEISLGSTGDEVKVVQYYIDVISYFVDTVPYVKIDGIFGPKTQEAIEAFQNNYGLERTGIVDRATWNKMTSVYSSLVSALSPEFYKQEAKIYPGYSLVVGTQNPSVSDLQTYLSAISNYYGWGLEIPITGIFGNQTLLAVKKFQQAFGLQLTGIVGPLTWNKIAQEYDKIIPGGK